MNEDMGEDFELPLICEFRDCQNYAEFEGWYRVLDFANQPTGLTQKMCVCKSCTRYLIGYDKTTLL